MPAPMGLGSRERLELDLSDRPTPRSFPQMHCCGVTDYRDWFLVLGENTVPDRCCMENSQGCGQNNTTLLWRTVSLGTRGPWVDSGER